MDDRKPKEEVGDSEKHWTIRDTCNYGKQKESLRQHVAFEGVALLYQSIGLNLLATYCFREVN